MVDVLRAGIVFQVYFLDFPLRMRQHVENRKGARKYSIVDVGSLRLNRIPDFLHIAFDYGLLV